jgi:hypothetical protein
MGDFAILYLAQSLAPVPYGIDANDCQWVKPNGNRKWIPYPWFLSKKIKRLAVSVAAEGKLSMARAAWLKVTCRTRDRKRRILLYLMDLWQHWVTRTSAVDSLPSLMFKPVIHTRVGLRRSVICVERGLKRGHARPRVQDGSSLDLWRGQPTGERDGGHVVPLPHHPWRHCGGWEGCRGDTVVA